MKTKKGDFIELEYNGKTKVDDVIFDTTDKESAKKEGIKNSIGSIIICVGEGNVLKKFDKELEDKEIGKNYRVDISSEEAFGKKNPKLIRIVSMSLFKKQKLNPYPGLHINAEGYFGVVRTVTSGRVVVDFNHPLAGKDVYYEFKIINKVDDVKNKIDCLAKFNLFPDSKFYELKIEEGTLIISSKIEFPEKVRMGFQEKINEFAPEIKKIEFSAKKKEMNTKE